MEAQSSKFNTPERNNKGGSNTAEQPFIDSTTQPSVRSIIEDTMTHQAEDAPVHHGVPSGVPVDPKFLETFESNPDLWKADRQQFPGLDNNFIPDVAPETILDNDSRVTSTSTLASSTLGPVDNYHNTSSAPHSPQSQSLAVSERSNRALTGTLATAKPPRPTSVPIVTSNSASCRRDRDDTKYPKYPDQYFNDLPPLQSQHCPPYQPHPLRPRTSHPSQNSSSSSIHLQGSQDQTNFVTGAKTVGNTPAQSPGLFESIYPTGRSKAEDSEDSQTSTPLLHPAHMQTPKETHKLSKEIDPISGRKIVNNYELLKKLGSGQHGTVKLARDLTSGDHVAVKIVRRHPRKRRLRRSEDTGELIKREIAILKKARHPHVVSLTEVIDDDEYQKVYLILEFVQRGEIIWRKKTDKDVAIFEMNRIRRDVTNNFDEDLERAEVERFNSTAVTRRNQKALAFEKRKAAADHGMETSEFDRPTSAASGGPFWSLEHGGDPDDDYSQPTTSRDDLDMYFAGLHHDRSSLASSIHDPLSVDPHETPKLTGVVQPKIPSPHSQPDSSPWYLGNLVGTMYGPYTLEEQSTEEILQSFLHQAVTADNDWSTEEQEFMHVPCLTISQALDVFRDTVLGLEYLHYQGIIHRDIKPANLLWTEDYRVKISDFGVSYLGKPIREDANNDEVSEPDAADLDEAIELAKTVGTPAFYAPELCDPDIFSFENKAKRPPVTGQIDVWALGVTLYGMIFGRLPFYDISEFGMYEKIAKEPLFVPRQRLKGVEDKPSRRMNSNKRFDDIVEYEDVDNELRDLLHRLLHKDPTQRISIKEVKHHPWVLRGIQNQPAWIDETDPNLQSEGRKIEISNQDVQGAVIPLFDRMVKGLTGGVKRVSSALGGRGRHRKRAASDIKDTESVGPSRSSKANSEVPEGRRASLRGDEQIFTALRASRENAEHPLTQSVTASPELRSGEDYFDDASKPMVPRSSPNKRPALPDRSISSVSTSESTRTIRAAMPPVIKENTSLPSGSLSTTTTIVDPSSPSSLNAIFGGSRRSLNKGSRDRGRTRDDPSATSSRSSSVSIQALAPPLEDPHGSPSLAFSTAVAAGEVNPPLALQNDVLTSTPPSISRPPLSHESSSEAFQKAKDLNDRRRAIEFSQFQLSTSRYRAASSATSIPCPPSPDDEAFAASHIGVSSSSDQMASNLSESSSHPSIPSFVSGASSLSGTIEPDEYPLDKSASPSTIVPRQDDDRLDEEDSAELTPRADEDEAGYNGEEEMDTDSDDGVLEMGGQSKKPKTIDPPMSTT
ncbi:MAG: hypothetical protein L6R42_002197 [Xanthoria sp. 1 TBL-2021]|nr:MAG: hypothetical protein L6R42_002197 [Xanthoria sp. 1 TBL-2021]